MRKVYKVTTETGDEYVLTYSIDGEYLKFETLSGVYRARILQKGTRDNEFLIEINGEVHRVFIENFNQIIVNNEILRISNIQEKYEEKEVSLQELISSKKGEIISPIYGRIVSLRVKEGDAVVKGQPLLSIESMKSETIISSPISGVIQKILVRVGQSVKKGDILLIIK
ncbi:MAG: biotin/lipoyl-binding protein [Sulfolobaceae archaeon]